MKARGGARAGAGRPPKTAAERCDKQLVLLVPEAIDAELRQAAKASGVSLGEHLRRVIAAGAEALKKAQ